MRAFGHSHRYDYGVKYCYRAWCDKPSCVLFAENGSGRRTEEMGGIGLLVAIAVSPYPAYIDCANLY